MARYHRQEVGREFNMNLMIARANIEADAATRWGKDPADERGLWLYGSTGWKIYAMAPGCDEVFRVYPPNSKDWTPAQTIEGAKAYVEMMYRAA